ncbi:MAG: hypothetical protein EAX90_08095 [Candidatus Heimdallarchaeota archaeon]|nr:hypothetical protein [Candidatus Heimdallarchaeota archaeon]
MYILKRLSKSSRKNYLLISLITIVVNPITAARSDLTLYSIYTDDWVPGNALGYPGFVSLGNFSGRGSNEILLISSIPEGGDVMTLTSFEGKDLTVSGSIDRDFSSVYYQLASDFDGDGDIEILISEEWSDDMANHRGSHHAIYDFGRYSFYRNESFYYSNPGIVLDLPSVYDFDENGDSEIILSAWDELDSKEIIRIYNYEDENLELLSNTSFLVEDDLYYRSVIYSGIGHFQSQSIAEIITISKWSLKLDPATMLVSYEVYHYDLATQMIEHKYSDILDVNSFSIFFDIYDVDNDLKDELITYFDSVFVPYLIIFEIDPLGAAIEYKIERSQSSYTATGWHCTDIYSMDVDNDDYKEIVISEAKLDFVNSFKGRYEIYRIKDSNIDSVLIQDINKPPSRTSIGNIDQFEDTEFVSVFNDYDFEDFSTKGGIEIWSTGKKKTKLLSYSESYHFLEIIIFTFIPIITVITYRKIWNYKNKS